MTFKLGALAAAAMTALIPASAHASFFEFTMSGTATGTRQPYCGFTMCDAIPVTFEFRTGSLYEDLVEGDNKVEIGLYRAAGVYSATIERRGMMLYGKDLTYFFGCAGGMCTTTFAKAATFTVSTTKGVPEPATWALMILGFGAIGYALRQCGSPDGDRARRALTSERVASLYRGSSPEEPGCRSRRSANGAEFTGMVDGVTRPIDERLGRAAVQVPVALVALILWR